MRLTSHLTARDPKCSCLLLTATVSRISEKHTLPFFVVSQFAYILLRNKLLLFQKDLKSQLVPSSAIPRS